MVSFLQNIIQENYIKKMKIIELVDKENSFKDRFEIGNYHTET